MEPKEKSWGYYDDGICQAIIRELPKTWAELWSSPSIRSLIKSERTLSVYLRYLRRLRSVRRMIDEKTDKVLYVSTSTIPSNTPRILPGKWWMAVRKLRRRDYGLAHLYWGGHVFGPERWWTDVKERAEKANSALERSIRLWFRKGYGAVFSETAIDDILNEFVYYMLREWGSMIDFYFSALFGDDMPIQVLVDQIINKDRKLTPSSTTYMSSLGVDLVTFERGLWYRDSPISAILEEIEEDTAFLALGVKAKYFSSRDVKMTLAKKIVEIASNAPPVAERLSFANSQSTELQKLADGYTSKDKATRSRVLEILSVKA